jgi:RimJ/RimL family protein N-acetyltransferase
MLLNEDVVLESASGCLRLVPYQTEHVPLYHEWMSSPELLRLTASEPLSLEEEYCSMQAWRDDPDKLTFIILDARSRRMVGDVNVVTNVDPDRRALAEVDVMIADATRRRSGLATEALLMAMAYAVEHLHTEIFIAKILEDNVGSLAMFEKLGFTRVRRVAAFHEIHYELVSETLRRELSEVRGGWTHGSYLKYARETGNSPITRPLFGEGVEDSR